MNANLRTSACDPERLESFLGGQLSDSQEREVALHLSSCEHCRRSLQQQAAEPEAWREAEELLRPTPFDSQFAEEDDDGPDSQHTGHQPLAIQNVLDALGPTDDPQMLGRLGGYEVSGVVGAGGMGVVLKAGDKSLDRTVAIKVLAPDLATSGAARKRFAREAKAAAAVLHPNVIAIHSVSNDESLPFLVMPYVRGTSLEKRLDREGPLSLQEILRIGAQIAAGLAAAHAQGLVHRDIKPANILLEEGVERVTITDFGLARAVDDATITRSGAIAGTPQYMSPEQARGEPVDGRSDLFSLGSVLYAIATGRPPFRAETTYGVIRRITDQEPTPIRQLNPDMPEWLCSIISRLMSKRADDRFASAAEVSELFEKCLAHVQQPAGVPLPASLVCPSKFSRACSTFRRWLGVFAMFAALGLGLLGMALWQASEAPDIAGNWRSEEWGEVVLKKTGDAQYTGTYSDTFGKPPGEIQLKWSRVERRFNGMWREGEDRLGELSVRLVGEEIRGAWTTGPQSKINPQTPRLADLTWIRSTGPSSKPSAATFGPVFEREVPNREAIDFDTGNQMLMPDAELNPDKGLLWILEQRLASLTTWMREQQMDALSEGSSLTAFGLRVKELKKTDWETMQPAEVVDALKVDWRKENPREFGIAIRAIDPKSPPHAILSMRRPPIDAIDPTSPPLAILSLSRMPRTLAFQTREGGVGILQILETTQAGLKVRFKLLSDAAQATPPSDLEPRTGASLPMRLNYFTTGHDITVACSADGKLIAVASSNPTRTLQVDGTSRVKGAWKAAADILNADTGQIVASLKLTTKEEAEVLVATPQITHVEATALAFSPDGSLVAVGTSIGQVKLFETRTGELVRTLDDEQSRIADQDTPGNWKPVKRALGSVSSLAFSPDGSLLVTGGGTYREFSDVFDGIARLGRSGSVTGPGRLKVWEVKTGELQHDLVGHGGQVNDVAFSPDGNLLASAGSWLDSGGSGHGTGVIIWNPKSGANLRTLAGSANGGTHAVAFSPNSKIVAIGAWHFDKETDTSSTGVSLVYALSGITEWERRIPGPANPQAFTPDGKSVLLLARQSIKLLDVATGADQREITSDDLSKDGRWDDFALARGSRLVIGAVDEQEGSIEIRELPGQVALLPPAVREIRTCELPE